MNSVWEKIISLKPDWKRLPHNKIYEEKMNDIYLKICYYNLLEKYLCNGIYEDDFDKIMQIKENKKIERLKRKIQI